jgi:hypothetical protein
VRPHIDGFFGFVRHHERALSAREIALILQKQSAFQVHLGDFGGRELSVFRQHQGVCDCERKVSVLSMGVLRDVV